MMYFLVNVSHDNQVLQLLLYFQLVICLFPGSSSPPSVAERVSRAIFGRYGGMVYSAAKILTFITVFGVMLALTVYYFDIKVDLKNFAMTSNTSMNT